MPAERGVRALPLDSQMLALLERSIANGRRPLAGLTVAEARAQLPAPAIAPSDPVLAVTEQIVTAGGLSIRVRRYSPVERLQGTLFYLHPGGWVLGSLDHSDPVCRELALRSRTSVLSVDYPLAPEHNHPVAYQVLTEILRELLECPDELPMVLVGESAGANVGLVALQQLPKPVLDRLVGAVLVVPLVDLSTTRESHAAGTDPRLVLSAPDLDWYASHYLDGAIKRSDPTVSPLLGHMNALPPTLVVSAGHDPLRDEAFELVARIRGAGVDVGHMHAPSLGHGFLGMFKGVDASDVILTSIAQTCRRYLDQSLRSES